MNKGLIALAFGGLAIGMTEFTMMGILQDIAKDQQIEITQAAHFIALYALGVVVGAPILTIFTGKIAPKKVLLLLMLLFIVFNGLFAIAPEYSTLAISRFMSGLPHGAFFGVGSVVAAQLVQKGKEAQAIAFMFTGMTIANLAGVPLGTYIGHHYSWRITYGIIAALGLITIASIYFWLPNMNNKTNGDLKQQLSYFKQAKAWLIVAVISIGTGGLFSWITYISPMVTKVGGLNEDRVPFIMILVGLGMFFGNILGGKLADTISPTKAAIACFTTMALTLVTVYFTAHITSLAYVMAFVTGMVAFTIGSPLQMMLITSAKGSENIAAAAGQASFNIGNTLGAYLGGIPITLGYAYNSPVLVGVGMAGIGAMLATVYLKKYLER
ncbi:MFS transporter, DHA1 family, arabinose polymer transporter [Paenimyroides ummariense]|uniref:MFS transporter, DHA1 family, arabinose polymer transporter n=1 Tax=Paenimyroides ummariense TaxID=913024 RepID=A0A1I4WLL5_9FLAO|nr:MFS transporter [Paenimyroides ummariense]SFN14395.1 MFS transporter, DHA1 family, arabinose polymer transporter [Paenimyroides ummariense]